MYSFTQKPFSSFHTKLQFEMSMNIWSCLSAGWLSVIITRRRLIGAQRHWGSVQFLLVKALTVARVLFTRCTVSWLIKGINMRSAETNQGPSLLPLKAMSTSTLADIPRSLQLTFGTYCFSCFNHVNHHTRCQGRALRHNPWCSFLSFSPTPGYVKFILHIYPFSWGSSDAVPRNHWVI